LISYDKLVTPKAKEGANFSRVVIVVYCECPDGWNRWTERTMTVLIQKKKLIFLKSNAIVYS
jgi:hypothetical protein